SREALRSTGTELRLMEPHGTSRSVRIVGPRAITGDRARRVRVVPISVSGDRVGRLQVLPRSDVPDLGPCDERMLAIARAQLGRASERGRRGKGAGDA